MSPADRPTVPLSTPSAGRIEEALADWRVRYRLNKKEVGLLRDAVHGADQDTLAALHGIADATLGTHVRNILRKTEARRLGEVVRRVLYEIVAGEDGVAERASGTFRRVK